MTGRKYYVFFTGHYQVIAASELLKRYGVASRIVKAPVCVKQSCSFALLIDAADMEMAKYLLDREHFCVRKVESAETNRS